MIRHSPALLGVFGILSGIPTTAHAADPPPHLSAQLVYTQAPGVRCAGEAVLRAEVARQLGYDPLSPEAKRKIVATVRQQGHTLLGEIEGFDEAGAPEWSKPAVSYPESACLALLAGMGNAIAFRLDPHVFPPKTAELPRPAESPQPMARAPLGPVPEAPKPRAAEPPGPFELGLGPALAIGAAGPAFAVIGHVGFRGARFSLGLDLRYDAPSSAQAESAGEGASAQAFSIGGALAPCVHVSYFLGCALLAGGASSVSLRGVDRPHPEIHPYLGTGPRLGFEKRFTPWLGVRLTGDALVMLETWRGTLNGAPMRAPSPLSSRVNGATGASLLAFF